MVMERAIPALPAYLGHARLHAQSFFPRLYLVHGTSHWKKALATGTIVE